jgi:hypothetical protein
MASLASQPIEVFMLSAPGVGAKTGSIVKLAELTDSALQMRSFDFNALIASHFLQPCTKRTSTPQQAWNAL